MDYLVISLVSLLAAGITLFSGFGLGTVLTPVFALFFPLPVAVACTAVVHLANNLFKLALVGSGADKSVAWRFGLAALGGSLVGAWILGQLTQVAPLYVYRLHHQDHEITLVKLVIAILIIGFAIGELLPQRSQRTFAPHYLPLGGALSGLFGGISGHQGALRSAFLIKANLSKEAFIATGVVCAVIVDLARLPLYAAQFLQPELLAGKLGWLILTATLTAFLGSYLGARLVHKITLRAVQRIVAVALGLIALSLGCGLI